MHQTTDRLGPDKNKHDEADDGVVVDHLVCLHCYVDSSTEIDDEECNADGLDDSVDVERA